MTSLVSLMTLNHFQISYAILIKIRNILFGITLACTDVCCQRTEFEIKLACE